MKYAWKWCSVDDGGHMPVYDDDAPDTWPTRINESRFLVLCCFARVLFGCTRFVCVLSTNNNNNTLLYNHTRVHI